MRLKPKDVAILLDRLLVLFERPVRISESRDLSVRSELSIDALDRIVELTRGRATARSSGPWLPAGPGDLGDLIDLGRHRRRWVSHIHHAHDPVGTLAEDEAAVR